MSTAIEQAMQKALNDDPKYQGRSVPEKPRKPRTPPKNLERLSIRDNHALCDFLLKYAFVPGESIEDVAASANQALDSRIINANHVRHRMEEFGLKLIPARNVDQSARIDLLEAAFTEVIERLKKFAPNVIGGPLGRDEMPALNEYLKSFGSP